MKGRPLAPPAALRVCVCVCAHAHAHAGAHAGMHSSHARIRMHTHARTAHTHLRTHRCTQSCTSGARALTTRPTARRRNRRGRCERGGGGTHSVFNFGQSAAAGSAASSVVCACLRAHPCGRAGRCSADRERAPVGRSRQPCARARLGQRPTTGSAAAAASNAGAERPQRPARQCHAAAAQRRHRRERARRRRRARDAQFLQELAPAERLGERLHLRGVDGPAAHRARVRPAPTAQPMGRRGDERAKATGKETTHARTHTRMRVIGTPTRSERRLYPEADATQRARTRARIRTNNRTPTRAPRRRSEVHVSKYGWMSMHIIYLAEPMAIEYTCTHRYLSVWVHTRIDTRVHNAAMGPYMMHAYEYISTK
jgi:hypothetical protein